MVEEAPVGYCASREVSLSSGWTGANLSATLFRSRKRGSASPMLPDNASGDAVGSQGTKFDAAIITLMTRHSIFAGALSTSGTYAPSAEDVHCVTA